MRVVGSDKATDVLGVYAPAPKPGVGCAALGVRVHIAPPRAEQW
jgi:nitrogenase subunit NifH